MAIVQLRNAGSSLWTLLTLPTSTQVAHTLVTAVKTLDIADEVRVQATAPTGKLDVTA